MTTLQLFHATIDVDPEDGSFVAECLEVGTVGRGATRDEALSEVQQGTEVYLQEYPGIVKPVLIKQFRIQY